MSPERAVRLLHAKAAELESMVPTYLDERQRVHPNHFAQDIRTFYEAAGNMMADIALVASILAGYIAAAEASRVLYEAHTENLIERVYALEGGDE